MRLSLSDKAITISLEENSTYFKEVTSALNEFTKTFWVNNILINLATQEEIYKRKLLLLSLYNKCSKQAKVHNYQFIKKLLDTPLKPIKLTISNTKSTIKVAQIFLQVIENKLLIRFDKSEKFVFWYFYNHFKPFEPKCDVIKREILFEKIDAAFKNELEKILSQNQIMKNQIRYHYNRFELNKLLKSKHTRINNAHEQIFSIESYYKLLQAQKEEPLCLIRKKYLRLAKIYHPDAHRNLQESEVKKRILYFQKIQEAYEQIKSHKKNAA